ncbi:ribonuclease HII [Notoacmeibacter ruber]|uniref:Ribonuclease HII n=1 Tax=Notoacmeibacter ruber TaxID=2670375 RepID=A0A3L7J9X2_9HYPH|nr:ribonuclease HII [Notoacmeibacter ruber]RLQ87416.1 ribonuclease HII [Notoacmeibacter ruber]
MPRPRPDSRTAALPLDMPPAAPDFRTERACYRGGARLVSGVDEAGRGPLAGPVVAASVILDPRRLPKGLNDSKRLSAARREELYTLIMKKAVSVSVCAVGAETIDRINILQASLLAMRRAICGHIDPPCIALIDGDKHPAGAPCETRIMIKGDQRSLSIAAASIVAKVTRDHMLARCCEQHPTYGFSAHAGYGTRVHRSAITAHGPVPRLHRLSFGMLRLPPPEAPKKDEFHI